MEIDEGTFKELIRQSSELGMLLDDKMFGRRDFAHQDGWLIWSHEHKGWWKQSEYGYTDDWREAGLFSLTHAIDLCTQASYGERNGIPEETMLHISSYNWKNKTG